MSKIIFLFTLLIAFLSCTNNDNQPSNNPTDNTPIINGTILTSYKQGDSSSFLEHFFENNGSRYNKIVRADGSRFIQYLYDSDNRMSQIVVSPDDNLFPAKTVFYYDNNNIIKMEKDRRSPGTTGQLYTYLFTYNQNTIDRKLISNQDPNVIEEHIRYTFNSNGFLTTYHDFSEFQPSPNTIEINTNLYATFEYDSNNNIIQIKKTLYGTHDLPDSAPNSIHTSIITYQYDNKTNPLYQIYRNHYLNYVFNNEAPYGILNGSFQDRIVFNGANNLIKTTYIVNENVGTPVDNIYENAYIYQANNLPKKMGRISTIDNIEYSTITFNYTN